MEAMLGTVLGIALAWAFGAVVLMIVGRLGLGLSVDGFVPAFIASAVISIVAGVILWALSFFGISVGGPGLLGAIVNLVVAAVVLLVSDHFVKGMKVNGFVGALVAAIAYGLVVWLIQWVLSLFL
ncbi:MAG: phage holin family protein [Caldilinea sp.]